MPPQRLPGRLRSGSPLADPEALLQPLTADDLALWDTTSLLPPPQP